MNDSDRAKERLQNAISTINGIYEDLPVETILLVKEKGKDGADVTGTMEGKEIARTLLYTALGAARTVGMPDIEVMKIVLGKDAIYNITQEIIIEKFDIMKCTDPKEFSTLGAKSIKFIPRTKTFQSGIKAVFEINGVDYKLDLYLNVCNKYIAYVDGKKIKY